jgi:ABC-type oligopeptide transport system substrate-binding subunit
VKVKLVRTEGKTYWARLAQRAPQIFLSGITAPYAHSYAFLSEFLSESRANWGHFASRDYDRLARDAAGAPDAAKAAAFATRAQRLLLARECAVVPLYFRATSSLIGSGWSGLFVNPLARTDLSAVGRK